MVGEVPRCPVLPVDVIDSRAPNLDWSIKLLTRLRGACSHEREVRKVSQFSMQRPLVFQNCQTMCAWIL